MATTSSPTATSPGGKTLVKTKSGLRMINLIDDERSPFDIEEPIWAPDSEQQICVKCGSQFSFTTRKHHCRRCGEIFCGNCCTTKVDLPRLGFVDPQRVCVDCIEVSKEENELFNRCLPLLNKGAAVQLNKEASLTHCKLESKSYRNLIFCNPKGGEDHEPIFLKDITTFQCLTDPLQPSANGVGQLVGVNLRYVNANSESKELKMQVSDKIRNRKESLAFLLMLQKAMKMIFDST